MGRFGYAAEHSDRCLLQECFTIRYHSAEGYKTSPLDDISIFLLSIYGINIITTLNIMD